MYTPSKLTFPEYWLNIQLEEKMGAAEGKEGKECYLWLSTPHPSALSPKVHTTAA